MSQSPVLVLNAGSSSLKYQLVVPETAEVQAKGLVERIGEPGSPVADHAAAMQAMTKDLATDGVDLDTVGIRAVGHRVVHGGPDFTDPTIIDDKVLEEIRDLIPLAPLHNPGAVLGIIGSNAMGSTAHRINSCPGRPPSWWAVILQSLTRLCCIWGTAAPHQPYAVAWRSRPPWA